MECVMAENREFAAYGYQSGTTMNTLGIIVILAVFFALGCSAFFRTPWFLLLLVVPVGVFVYVKRTGCDKPLLIAGRYLILGERIVYYGSVVRASLDKERQTLTITAKRGLPVVIAAEKFPTNARKPDKIRINKSAKFYKVAERILTRLRAAAPDADIS